MFGSYASGKAVMDSDVDLLVITSEAFGPHNSRRKALAKIWKCLGKTPTPVDIILSSEDEVTKWKNTTNHLIAHAMREGKVLYERHRARK
ncbi:MAG: nucleotidyltransferase domain-containing protein [Magnetococcales bacterium]|nr:nucleotidyltransferase domain-containing protein [Magnetococcales bacterium]